MGSGFGRTAIGGSLLVALLTLPSIALAPPGPASKPDSQPAAETPKLPALRPVLDRANYDAWKRTIQPTVREASWREIPWQPTLQAGFRLAHTEKKPVLLWIMNGHPLGCT